MSVINLVKTCCSSTSLSRYAWIINKWCNLEWLNKDEINSSDAKSAHCMSSKNKIKGRFLLQIAVIKFKNKL